MSRRLISILVLLFAVLLLCFDAVAADAARDALAASVAHVLPALFPYMVLSSVVLTLDLAAPILRVLPMRALGFPDAASPVLLMGALCGFPLGATGAASLYADGKLSRTDAARLAAVSSRASPAFLIGTVGGAWHAKGFGVYLTVVGLVFAIVTARLLRPRTGTPNAPSPAAPPTARFISVLCRAIGDSAAACLGVMGSIVFFRVVAAVLSAAIPFLTIPATLFFEFSHGALYGASVGGMLGAAATGFAVGFAGLAVFFQLSRPLDAQEIPLRPLFAVKLAEGCVTATLAAVYAAVVPLPPCRAVPTASHVPEHILLPVVLLLFVSLTSRFLARRKYFRAKA